MIALAVVFLVVVFLVRFTSIFSNSTNYSTKSASGGLQYDTKPLVDAVNTDTDGDGVPDWQERLYGTDPTKKDTNDDGIPDNIEIDRIKKAQGVKDETPQDVANLTQTDKFARELFSTTATLSQNGAIDPTTADQLSASLAQNIQNIPQKKVYTLSDLKIITQETPTVIKAYHDNLVGLKTKYPAKGSTLDILQEFAGTDNQVNPDALKQLDPDIVQLGNIVNELQKMGVPKSLAPLHLKFLNIVEFLSENLKDIRLYDTDPIVALGAISQYQANIETLTSINTDLENAIMKK